MALSQYVAINFLTKFDKKGLERATKELKGFDKFVASSAFRLRAGLAAGGIATAASMALLAKRSLSAALAQEQLDKSLKLTLNSIGRGGMASEVGAFIEGLQSATNVSENQLIPALQQLIAQTGDLEASQGLLRLALDVSAGTGKDLSTTLDAITKAAIGNYKSIGALGVGFTAAEAKTMGFAKTMQTLQKYTGSAEAATLTLDGQIKAFRISAGEATETLGQGMLTAYAIISEGRPLIQNLGTDLEKTANQFSNILIGVAAVTKKEGLGIFGELAKVAIEGFVGEYGTLQKIENAGIKAISLEKISANQREDRVQTTKKILTFDEMIANIQKKILATEKLTTKEKVAQQLLDKKRSELQAIFDIDRINLQAALSRKLNAEDEIRVKILQKLADGTAAAVNEAERYADVLKVIEDGVISTEEIDMLAKKWGISTTEVVLYLQKLFAANEELRKMLALLQQISSIPLGGQTGVAPRILGNIDYTVPIGTGKPAYAEGITPTKMSYMDFGNLPRMADGGIVNQPTIAMIGEAGAEAVVPLDRMGGFGTTVNVNVAGSVISEGELQSVIQDALYNLNRAGAVTQLTNLGR